MPDFVTVAIKHARELDNLRKENSALRIALLQERERCAKKANYLAFEYTQDLEFAENLEKDIRALPDPCDLTEARKVMEDAERYQYFRTHRRGTLFYWGVDEEDPPEVLDAAIDAAISIKEKQNASSD